MRTVLTLAAVAALIAIPSSTMAVQSPAPELAAWTEALRPCRAAVAASFRHDEAETRRIVASFSNDEGRVMLCTAYTLGARDMAEGLILPLDVN